eukprot:TRINITY_DN2000_c0_g1_i1.p1 TRINITY_DN2000_c0_g1~~TRINITY_DN2000_c0_g1_i1.p1  ORF type:complete len:634 (+),score=30.58 TRINITY_DN2000_c0_g1_i1:32-1903(+)
MNFQIICQYLADQLHNSAELRISQLKSTFEAAAQEGLLFEGQQEEVFFIFGKDSAGSVFVDTIKLSEWEALAKKEPEKRSRTLLKNVLYQSDGQGSGTVAIAALTSATDSFMLYTLPLDEGVVEDVDIRRKLPQPEDSARLRAALEQRPSACRGRSDAELTAQLAVLDAAWARIDKDRARIIAMLHARGSPVAPATNGPSSKQVQPAPAVPQPVAPQPVAAAAVPVDVKKPATLAPAPTPAAPVPAPAPAAAPVASTPAVVAPQPAPVTPAPAPVQAPVPSPAAVVPSPPPAPAAVKAEQKTSLPEAPVESKKPAQAASVASPAAVPLAKVTESKPKSAPVREIQVPTPQPASPSGPFGVVGFSIGTKKSAKDSPQVAVTPPPVPFGPERPTPPPETPVKTNEKEADVVPASKKAIDHSRPLSVTLRVSGLCSSKCSKTTVERCLVPFLPQGVFKASLRETHRRRPYAVVDFSDAQDAERCLDMGIRTSDGRVRIASDHGCIFEVEWMSRPQASDSADAQFGPAKTPEHFDTRPASSPVRPASPPRQPSPGPAPSEGMLVDESYSEEASVGKRDRDQYSLDSPSSPPPKVARLDIEGISSESAAVYGGAQDSLASLSGGMFLA